MPVGPNFFECNNDWPLRQTHRHHHHYSHRYRHNHGNIYRDDSSTYDVVTTTRDTIQNDPPREIRRYEPRRCAPHPYQERKCPSDVLFTVRANVTFLSNNLDVADEIHQMTTNSDELARDLNSTVGIVEYNTTSTFHGKFIEEPRNNATTGQFFAPSSHRKLLKFDSSQITTNVCQGLYERRHNNNNHITLNILVVNANNAIDQQKIIDERSKGAYHQFIYAQKGSGKDFPTLFHKSSGKNHQVIKQEVNPNSELLARAMYFKVNDLVKLQIAKLVKDYVEQPIAQPPALLGNSESTDYSNPSLPGTPSYY